MQAIAGVSAVAAVFVLAAGAGCRQAYLVDSAVLVSAVVAQNEDTARQEPLGPLILAMPVQEPVRADAQGAPAVKPVRVRLWALSIDEAVPGTRYWRASAPHQRTYLAVGGSLLGLGLAAVLGAAVSAGVLASTSCAGLSGESCAWGHLLGPLLISLPVAHVGAALIAAGGSMVRYGRSRIGETAGE